MPLSNPRTFFGIHSISPYNKTTRDFYGTMKVLKGSAFSLSGETVSLTGGSSKYPWGVEDGLINAELSLTFNEYPTWCFELFLGKALTEVAAQASGNVSSLTNVSGTSVMNASTGIASVTATAADEADLKFGKYTITAIDATTVNVACSSDIDFARGTDGVYESDTLDINAAAITIVDTGATVEIPIFGLTLTSGSGTVAMVAGESAEFEVLPINSGSYSATFGGTADTYPNFGAIIYAQQKGSSEMVRLDIFDLKAIGMPINFNPQEFSEAEVTAVASYDSTRNGVFSIQGVDAV